MPSSKKTPQLGLSQLEPQNKFVTADYNRDMNIIDEEAQRVSAQLGEKANATTTLASGSVRQVLDGISGSYIVTSAVSDMPIPLAWWICSADVKAGTYCRIDATLIDNPEASFRLTHSNGKWNQWVPLSTRTPVQEKPLPISNGWVGKATFFKDQEGICAVNVNIIKDTAFGAGTHTVATIPVAYRPDTEVSCCAINTTVSGPLTTVSRLIINSGGNVLLQTRDTAAAGISATITYNATR